MRSNRSSLPLQRIEDALARQRRAKERFLARPWHGRGRARPQGARRQVARRATSTRRSPTRWRASHERRLRKPRALAPGARLAVVAPASPFDRDEFDAGVAELRALGFEPGLRRVGVRARRRISPGRRTCARPLSTQAWQRPAIAALIAVRGGYGSVQLLPLLDPEPLRAPPKASSATATSRRSHVGSRCQCGIVAFHGPMLDGRLARGAAGTIATSFLRAVSRPSRSASCSGRRSRRSPPAKPRAGCSAAH